MTLLNDRSLENSSVVANSTMNRERHAVGTNSYEKDLGVNPIEFIANRLLVEPAVRWLDLCCGRGRALIDVATFALGHHWADRVALHGVDLVNAFDVAPANASFLHLEVASLHSWKPGQSYHLITCVHGLHYVGDKLGLVERAIRWLAPNGLFAANIDLTNLRDRAGQSLARPAAKCFRENGLGYNSRRHVLRCSNLKVISLGWKYLGADDTAGPNYSGQEAVDSYYEVSQLH